MRLDTAAATPPSQARDAGSTAAFRRRLPTARIYCRPVCTGGAPRREPRAFTRARRRPSSRASARACAAARSSRRATPAWIPCGRPRAGGASRIEAGALNGGGVEGARRRAWADRPPAAARVEREFGVSPVGYAQTRGCCSRSAADRPAPAGHGEVALASGFSSVRRFNALFRRTRYRLNPKALRKPRRTGADADIGSSSPTCRPPLDWPALLAFLGEPRRRRRRGGQGSRSTAAR